VHYGVTSYDVEDCATALQLREALSIVKNDLLDLEEVLLVLTDKYRNLLMVGRTHGQYAGVITLGFKFAVWTREVARHLRRLKDVEDRVLVGKVSGVVGTGASLGKRALKVQEIALRKLGLKPVDIATQVVQRDLHAEVVSYLALLACSLDKFALEIRNLQRSEIQEIQEPFKEERQVGSSAVPAKRNPIKCEKVCSLARLMRSLVIPAYENVALWHERDLTNSANERFIIPMSFLILDEMLKTMKEVLKGLVVLPENVKRNLESARDIIFSERVMLKLVERGVERQKAHEVIRRGLVEALKKGVGLKDILLRDELVSSKLTEGELEECWDYGGYLGATQKLIDNVMRMTKEELKAFRVQY
jgi:adenylosuccinate lyase